MKLKVILLVGIIIALFQTTLSAKKDTNILAYKDRGVKYYPKYVRKGLVKYGKASWYGKPFHLRLTASGERYNMYNMTAAHRTYAIGTILKVTNLRNRRSVRVRINDRGPFYSTRDIDLSYGAARKIGLVQKGVGKVKIEVISSGSKRAKYHLAKLLPKRVIKKAKIVSTKSKRVKSKIAQKKSQKIHKVQVASFFSKKYANAFKKNNKLKSATIVEKYLKSKKRTTYRVVINCSQYEAEKILKSKKFSGAYLIS